MLSKFVWPRFAGSMILLVLLSFSQACSPSVDGGPSASATPQLSFETDITWGPGTFTYTDPTAGLADLSSYSASIKLSFDGTRAGSAENWAQASTMVALNDPPARQWTIEKTTNGSAPEVSLRFELDGLDYEKQGDSACLARNSDPEQLLSERLEPAAFLDPLIGAEQAGADTVNGIEATHYTFDQRALGLDGLTESRGELWVAVDGGYLLKYLLTTKAGPDYFGEGLDGTLTVHYELTGPNAPVEISLPEDCPPGLIAAPRLPDATNISSSPGVLGFDSSTSIPEAAAFYEKELPPLGWISAGDSVISDESALLTYTRGAEAMILTIEAGGQRSTVTIVVGPNQDLGF